MPGWPFFVHVKALPRKEATCGNRYREKGLRIETLKRGLEKCRNGSNEAEAHCIKITENGYVHKFSLQFDISSR